MSFSEIFQCPQKLSRLFPFSCTGKILKHWSADNSNQVISEFVTHLKGRVVGGHWMEIKAMFIVIDEAAFRHIRNVRFARVTVLSLKHVDCHLESNSEKLTTLLLETENQGKMRQKLKLENSWMNLKFY